MAIYHFSGTIVSRSQGRSAVACAAYRAGETLRDNYYQKTHDYQYKKDVAFTEILLPKGAPEWMKDRAQLWNFVEANEKRKDAQLAREFNFALPKELTIEQNIALAKSFVQTQFVDKGMVADLAVHNDLLPTGEHQPHAHVMLTLREVTSEGFGLKVRAWNQKDLLISWREAWANSVNQALAQYGFDVKVDHRTLEAQNIPLEPQHKIGPVQAKDQMARLVDHQRIARENGLKLLNEPEIVLHALTQQQSTFSEYDIVRFINRHSVDAPQFRSILPKVMALEELVNLGVDGRNQKRFTTKTMLGIEHTMLEQATRLTQSENHPTQHDVKSSALDPSLTSSLTQEQTSALDYLTSPQGISCVIGYAGTGKSYLLGVARTIWEAAGYRVLGAALSGIAAENLAGSSGIPSRTIASYLYHWNRGEGLSSRDILVLDEAGMVGSRQMAAILDKVYHSGAKLVLVGDPEQLQSIEAGAAFRALTERLGFKSLTEIKRQTHTWQQTATKEFATGQTAQAMTRYHQHHHVHAFPSQMQAQSALIDLWYDAKITQPDQSQIILAYTRQEVKALNLTARRMRELNHELGVSQLIQTTQGERLFAPQERIYFLKNDYDLGVKNGSLGTLESIEGDWLTIRLDQPTGKNLETSNQTSKSPNQNLPQTHSGSKRIRLHIKHYSYLDYGYAATVHKAQGVTVDRCYVLVSRYFDRHSTYVTASRHRESLDLFWSEEAFKHQREMISMLSRERSKDVTLDYIAFGAKRDIYPLKSNYQKERELSREQVTPEFDVTSKQKDLTNQVNKDKPSKHPTKQNSLKHSQNKKFNPKKPKTEISIQPEKVSSNPSFNRNRETEESINKAPGEKTYIWNQMNIQSDGKTFKQRLEEHHKANPQLKLQRTQSFSSERLSPKKAKSIQERTQHLTTASSITPRDHKPPEAPKSIHEQHFSKLEKAHQDNPSYKTESDLMNYALQLNKQPSLMSDLKKQAPEFSAKIESLVKTHQRQLELDLDMEL